ncbi:hypothetical protein SCLCIDRAFT_697455 [Scleroderma citrinum Foug A]|uniref:Uncharacterized protein n=1 Tax=Scleroderma citrinum Foug A TaxID=1036808 RepID=A0A0C3AWM9_9AGAM|nr:hypothetical protein SCLCIDRAFT_697455 [Scleroderma citrinum Foug A]
MYQNSMIPRRRGLFGSTGLSMDLFEGYLTSFEFWCNCQCRVMCELLINILWILLWMHSFGPEKLDQVEPITQNPTSSYTISAQLRCLPFQHGQVIIHRARA